MSERPQKASNSYARMFAAQKEKKAKETKENEGKNSHNNDVNHKSGVIEHVNPPHAYMDEINYGGHPNTGWTVDNGIPSTYDPALGTCTDMRWMLVECLLNSITLVYSSF